MSKQVTIRHVREANSQLLNTMLSTLGIAGRSQYYPKKYLEIKRQIILQYIEDFPGVEKLLAEMLYSEQYGSDHEELREEAELPWKDELPKGTLKEEPL